MKKMVLGLLVAAQALTIAPAFAGSKGRMNTAAVLSGAAVYSIYKYGQKGSTGRRNTAIATTAGAAYAWHKYNKAKKSERNKERRQRAYYQKLAAKNKREANYYRARSKRVARR